VAAVATGERRGGGRARRRPRLREERPRLGRPRRGRKWGRAADVVSAVAATD
jgi:hypothetical protein